MDARTTDPKTYAAELSILASIRETRCPRVREEDVDSDHLLVECDDYCTEPAGFDAEDKPLQCAHYWGERDGAEWSVRVLLALAAAL